MKRNTTKWLGSAAFTVAFIGAVAATDVSAQGRGRGNDKGNEQGSAKQHGNRGDQDRAAEAKAQRDGRRQVFEQQRSGRAGGVQPERIERERQNDARQQQVRLENERRQRENAVRVEQVHQDNVRRQQENKIRVEQIHQENARRQDANKSRGIDQMRDRQRQNSSRYQSISREQQAQLQRQRYNDYNQKWSYWQQQQAQRQRILEQQRRLQYLRYQQAYWNRLRQDQIRLQQARYYDNLVNNYSYYRGGNYYYTNQYGAQMLQQAVNNGYEQGYYAGRADRNDGWGYNINSSYGYQDAAYGYDSYYVGLDEYQYYFRQGFERGYQDGYYSSNRYGTYNNGKYAILGSILGTILQIAINR